VDRPADLQEMRPSMTNRSLSLVIERSSFKTFCDNYKLFLWQFVMCDNYNCHKNSHRRSLITRLLWQEINLYLTQKASFLVAHPRARPSHPWGGRQCSLRRRGSSDSGRLPALPSDLGPPPPDPLEETREEVTHSHRVSQNHLNYPGSSAQAITIKATPAQTHFKRNNSWSIG